MTLLLFHNFSLWIWIWIWWETLIPNNNNCFTQPAQDCLWPSSTWKAQESAQQRNYARTSGPTLSVFSQKWFSREKLPNRNKPWTPTTLSPWDSTFQATSALQFQESTAFSLQGTTRWSSGSRKNQGTSTEAAVLPIEKLWCEKWPFLVGADNNSEAISTTSVRHIFRSIWTWHNERAVKIAKTPKTVMIMLRTSSTIWKSSTWAWAETRTTQFPWRRQVRSFRKNNSFPFSQIHSQNNAFLKCKLSCKTTAPTWRCFRFRSGTTRRRFCCRCSTATQQRRKSSGIRWRLWSTRGSSTQKSWWRPPLICCQAGRSVRVYRYTTWISRANAFLCQDQKPSEEGSGSSRTTMNVLLHNSTRFLCTATAYQLQNTI